MSRILICGGAGYVGSHMCQWLSESGHHIDVLDNLSTGHRGAVRWGDLYVEDIRDYEGISRIFRRGRYDSVMHFCAHSLVGQSVENPYEYYDNNVSGTLNVLRAMRDSDVDNIVFSSTAAVFGMPQRDLIDEGHPTAPINPYGASKLMVERVLADASRAYGLKSVALRYFNAAGASHTHNIGEAHVCETHLIPNVLKFALGATPELRVFGDDYETPDGTCVRDYVHVQDLAQAHELALSYMSTNDGAHIFNLGNGKGFSIKEVIESASRAAGTKIDYKVYPRREGDPPRLVAASDRARTLLGWEPKWTNLDGIIQSAWEWHKNPAF